MNEVVIVKRPLVAREARQMPVAGVAIAFALLGVGVFSWLSEARAAQEERSSALPSLPSNATAPAPGDAPVRPGQQGGAATNTIPPTSAFFDPSRQKPVTLMPTGGIPARDFSAAVGGAPRPRGEQSMSARFNAPSLVIDLAQNDTQHTAAALQQQGTVVDERGVAVNTTTTTVAVPSGGTIGGGGPSPANNANLSDTERFSSRIGNEEVEVARATRMTGLDRLVPQGAVIGATMETALNSDLPGFARAITQRSVFSFDGSSVLIPAGSRIIGQYKSGVAQGASRVFILWTRLIRPDGVSIELGSPATDDLGRGGVSGKVNRHFFQRFGGAILTSVLSGGISAAAAALSGGSTILVGSASQASSLAGQASQGNDIPPTITTRQGAPVRIFVARDLDFSAVGPAR